MSTDRFFSENSLELDEVGSGVAGADVVVLVQFGFGQIVRFGERKRARIDDDDRDTRVTARIGLDFGQFFNDVLKLSHYFFERQAA